MTFDQFKASLSQSAPPAELDAIVAALWYDGKGDWQMAHTVAQDIETSAGSWVHAYLHRKEGDDNNAAYWYRRAKRPLPVNSLQEEWSEIARELLKGL